MSEQKTLIDKQSSMSHQHQTHHECCPSMKVSSIDQSTHQYSHKTFCPFCGDDCQCGSNCHAMIHYAAMISHQFKISLVAQAQTSLFVETFQTLPLQVLDRPPQA